MKALYGRLSDSYFAKLVLGIALYSVVLYFSYYLIPPGGAGAAFIWPPAAVGIALLWFLGIEMWPVIAISHLIMLLGRGIMPPLAVATAVANVTESVAAVYLLRHYVGFSPMMNRLRDTLGFIATAMLGAITFALIATVSVFVFNQRPSLNIPLFISLWIGHLVSLLALGPFLLRWLYRPLFTKTSSEIIEGVALFGSIFTLSVLMTWTPYTSVGGIALLYIFIIPLIWAALRAGPRGISLALALFALIASTGLIYGYAPITNSANVPQAVFGVQMIIGVLSLIFLLFTSITEERKEAVVTLEGHVEKLQLALDKISSEDQAKSDFIAILAHELRNPLSPILSGLELLKQEEKADPEVLQMMGAHLNTTARLLDDLLDISRISQKKFRLQKEQVEIHDIINRCLEMVAPQMSARRHTLTTRIMDEEVRFSADPLRLTQIFVNLLNNAAKYTDPGGHISLEVRREGAELVAIIADNGVGIPAHRLPNIFEPFGGNEMGGHRPGGLRIGLSLAKRMAQMHHGSIAVESAGEGRGSTFTVRLPLPPTMQLPLPETSPAQKARVRGRFSKQAMEETVRKLGCIKVLVVDDNEAAAEGLRKLLEHHGHEVRVAYDAPQGLDEAERMHPDVAILDIGLPTMSGYELAQKMRERYGERMTLVALTGYGQTDDKQKALSAGFDEHLVKPVSITDVQRVLVELRA